MSALNIANQSNAVLVVGGGIAGIKAAFDLAEAGRQVYVVDKAPTLGGFLPLLDRQFPTNDCNLCYVTPERAKEGLPMNIEALPLTEVTKLDGVPGAFTVELTTQPRFLDCAKLTDIDALLAAAPEGAVRFTPGLDMASPTCMRYPQKVPTSFSIDKSKLGEDLSWTDGLTPGLVDLNQQATTRTVTVGSVIVASGAELFDPTPLDETFGYASFKDVVTSLEFEQILSAVGPTKGEFARPSDGKKPKRIGWIQCVGSRTTKEPGKPYCSSICCMFAMKEAAWAKEHFAEDLDATVFFMDMRPMGKDYEQYYQRVKNELGVNFVRCRPHTVSRNDKTGELLLSYVGEDGSQRESHLDMVVLATGFCAAGGNQALAQTLGVELDQYNFFSSEDFEPVSTSREGIYTAGMASGPKDIPDSMAQAAAATALANSHLAPPRVSWREDNLPPERDPYAADPKVGVFFCDWSKNVAATVDIARAMEATRFLPGVTHVEESQVAGGRESLDTLVASIKAQDLDRVVIAGYSPRTHGKLFAEAVRAAGLNRSMVEVANIRDQAAMVHYNDPAAATAKAIDLVRMAVASVKLAKPMYLTTRPMNHEALVVGGGVAGMTAALALADQNVRVTLLERGPALGGIAAQLKRTLDGRPVADRMAAMADQVKAHFNIRVITDALIVDHDGQAGDFTTAVQHGPSMYYEEIRHGVTILATGAAGYKPTEFLYGQDGRVVTQLEFESILESGQAAKDKLGAVVMIQCVGSRNQANPACGRICCRAAVKNALWVKEIDPEAQVVVLYRDMRMPFTAEDAYRHAREQGVLFVRYSPENQPRVTKDGDAVTVIFNDPLLNRDFIVEPDTLVLSVPQVAVDEETEELAQTFHLSRGEGGFIVEEHPKIKPVDTPAPGVFAAGSVLAPKSIGEARTQGLAAAGRALTLLAQEAMRVAGAVAKVKGELCAACLVCVRACPVGVPFINADGYSEIDPAKCVGCGICAAECPAKAIQLVGFSDDRIMGGIDALLEGVL